MSNEITIRQQMQLTSENVEAVFTDCITDSKKYTVRGVQLTAHFDRDKIAQHEADIFAMLTQLPKQFLRSGGGGWSFLNMCIDCNGVQWTDFHSQCDKLVCLGLAIGALDFVYQRDLWQCFPGGVPYIFVNDLYTED